MGEPFLRVQGTLRGLSGDYQGLWAKSAEIEGNLGGGAALPG